MVYVDDNTTASVLGVVGEVITEQTAPSSDDYVSDYLRASTSYAAAAAVTAVDEGTTSAADIMTSLLNMAVGRDEGTEDASLADHVTLVGSPFVAALAPSDSTTSSTFWSSSSPPPTPTPTPTTRIPPVPVAAMPTRQIDSTLTGWIAKTDGLTALHGSYNLYVLYATFGLMLLCFLLLVCWVQCKKRLALLRYERLPVGADDRDAAGFVYKPSNGDLLDDEYENTFVGVSVPILQDVTKL